MAKERRSGNLSPEFALLGFLYGGPSYGYDLHQKLSAELGQVWHLSQSQAYAILKRLEHRGDISAQVVEQNKLPAKQMLKITAAGRKRFTDWLETNISSNARSIRLEFLTRLYFVQLYKPEKAAHIYRAQYNELAANIRRLKALLANIPANQKYNRLSIELRLRQLKLIQTWMGEIKTQFQIKETAS
jgi:DNA-binding PadR family transcriptional regulator